MYSNTSNKIRRTAHSNLLLLFRRKVNRSKWQWFNPALGFGHTYQANQECTFCNYYVSLCSHSNNTNSLNPTSNCNCHTCSWGYEYKLLCIIVKELSTYIHLLYSFNTLYMKPSEWLWQCIVSWNSNTFGSKVYPPIMCIAFQGYISDVSLLGPLIPPTQSDTLLANEIRLTHKTIFISYRIISLAITTTE